MYVLNTIDHITHGPEKEIHYIEEIVTFHKFVLLLFLLFRY